MELKAPIADSNRILRHLQLRHYKPDRRNNNSQWSFKTILPPLGQCSAFGGFMISLLIQAGYQTISNPNQWKVDSINGSIIGSIPTLSKVRLIVLSVVDNDQIQSRQIRVLIPINQNGKRTYSTRMIATIQLISSSKQEQTNGLTPNAFVTLTQTPSKSVNAKVLVEDLFGLPTYKTSKLTKSFFANEVIEYSSEYNQRNNTQTLHHLLKSVPNIHSEQLQMINSRLKEEGVLPIFSSSIGPSLLAFTLDNCLPGAMTGLRPFTDKTQNASGSMEFKMRFNDNNNSINADAWNDLQSLFNVHNQKNPERYRHIHTIKPI